MSTDYSKKKNAELEELLKARGLPHTGKKAELVARLQASDAEAAKTSTPAHVPTQAAEAAAAAPAEDVIDWDDDAAAAATEPAAAAIAAGGIGRIANPAAVPNQIETSETIASADNTAEHPAEGAPDAAPAAPAQDFSSHLPSTTLDAELEKRKKRAARFGTTADTASEEATKSLERAKKFGGSELPQNVKGLDSALPDRVIRGEKRGREEAAGRGGRDAKRQDSTKRNENTEGASTAVAAGAANGGGAAKVAYSTEQTEKDRLALEKRKARFAGGDNKV